MKWFLNVLCVCCALACAVGCGGEPTAPVDLVQSAIVDPAYNTPITYPTHMTGYPPPHAVNGTEWSQNWIGGWIDQYATDLSGDRTRPNLGWPSRLAKLTFFRDDHTAMGQAQLENGGYFFSIANDNSVRRQVLICSWDKRFPWSTGVLANKWCQQFPMYTTGVVNGVWQNQRRLYVAEQGFTHGYGVNDPQPLHMNDGIFQVSTLIMDQYVRCEICSGSNMTGSCKWFGYYCPDQQTCSVSPGAKASQLDIRQWTQDASGNPYLNLAFKCEWTGGSNTDPGTHGVPPQPYYPG